MTRVIIICEGKTEREFIKKIVSPHLSGFGINVSFPILGKPSKKGGDVRGVRVIGDIVNFLRNDKSAYCTTFLDFYGMKSDVPGKNSASSKMSHGKKKEAVENAICEVVKGKVGDTKIRRFKPYVQMYEFEGLLFSNPDKMSYRLSEGNDKFGNLILSECKKILNLNSPEEINDSAETSPSKRIEKMVPSYAKIIDGISLAEDIGLREIRQKCPLFNEWINWLENLSKDK